MSTRTTGIIWALAIVCAIVALLARSGTSSTVAIDALAVPDMPALDELVFMELQRGDSTWTFERDADGKWWQRAPFSQRMDASRLLALPQLLQSLRAVARVELDATQASVLGVSMPGGDGNDLGRLRIRGSDGNLIDVHMGRTGIGGRGWLRLGDEPHALVVDDDLHAMALYESPSTWRDARLLPGTSADAARVEWLFNGERITLERTGRTWRFIEPVATRADAALVAGHLGELARTRFQTVLLDEPTDPAAFGLAPPVASITVHTAGGTSDTARTLLIGERVGGTSGDRFAMIDGVPSVVRVDRKTVAELLADPIKFIDHTGSSVAPMDVRSVRILTANATVELVRDLDRWRVVDGPYVDRAMVDGLLETLLATPASDVTLRDNYPRELEVATVVLEGLDGRPLDTVRVLREPVTPQGGGRWGLENGDNVIRILPEGTWLPLAGFGP